MLTFFWLLCLTHSAWVFATSPQSFAGSQAVQKLASKLLAHANTAIKNNNSENIVGSFLPNDDSKQFVDIFDDVPVHIPCVLR
jgi:hypothetical protein